MARPYRLQGANCFYHITSRGDDKKRIYISEYDYKKFLEYLLAAKEKFKFYLYSYVLMPNHYHLFIETLQPNLSKIMQYVNTSYTTYYNIKRQKCGHLFQGRYKSILVDNDAYFLELTRYIHLNPLRAKVVNKPEEYRWSSYKGYINQNGDGCIDKKQIALYLDMDMKQYMQFVMDGVNKEFDPSQNVYAGFILGKSQFIKDKLNGLKMSVQSRGISYNKELSRCIEKDDIIQYVAQKYRKTTNDLLRIRRRSIQEKKVAIYLLKKFTILTNPEIGEIFGISYSAISKAASDIAKLIENDSRIRNDINAIISRFKA